MLVPWNFLPSALRYFEIVAWALFANAQVRSVLHREMFPCLKQLLLASGLVCVIFSSSSRETVTLFPRIGEEMIPARHMSVLIFSASQAVTECLEMVQKLHIRACPASGAYSSTSVLGRMLFLFPNLGWENSAGWSGNRCLPVPAWLLWWLRLFQVEAVGAVVKGKCFLKESQTLIQPTVQLLSLFCLVISKWTQEKKNPILGGCISFSSKTFI